MGLKWQTTFNIPRPKSLWYWRIKSSENDKLIGHVFSTWRPRQKGRCFAGNIFKLIFLKENCFLSIHIFIPHCPIIDDSTLKSSQDQVYEKGRCRHIHKKLRTIWDVEIRPIEYMYHYIATYWDIRKYMSITKNWKHCQRRFPSRQLCKSTAF